MFGNGIKARVITFLYDYIWVINLVLILSLVYVISDTVKIYLTGNNNITQSHIVLAKFNSKLKINQTIAEQYEPEIESIVSRDLFNASRPEREDKIQEITNLIPKRKEILPLELRGIFFFSRGSKANLATVFNNHTQKSAVLRIGDEICMAKVSLIESEHIILTLFDGSEQKLKVKAHSRLLNEPAQITPAPAVSMVGELVSVDNSINEIEKNIYEIKRNLIDETLADMSTIVAQARLIPNFIANGQERQIEGFRIYRIREGSIFEQLGLVNGDVILTVNNNSLNNINIGFQLFESLKNENNISLQVDRQGEILDLAYRII